ncbi:platelet-activating factor acetylhydrolase [Apiospora arundinis]
MRSIKLCIAVTSLAWHQVASSGALPPPTGPYHVGLQKHAVPVLNEADPFWPNNISTSFLVTVFYPTEQEPEARDLARPYLDPTSAALYEALYNLTAGRLATITSPGLIPDAKPLDLDQDQVSSPPTLFFGPGGGGPMAECYTILLADLASHGYTVLAMDHPYEQPFARYPNGTGVYGPPLLRTALAVQSARVNDSLALFEYLPALETKLKKAGGRRSDFQLNQTHIGVFGHSLGGSTAAATLLADQGPQRRFRAGMNIDGTFFGPAGASDNKTDTDVRRPFMIMGFEGHGTRYNATSPVSDPTWPAFTSHQQTAYWRWINVKGALHHDFSDIAYWKTLVPELRDDRLGPIGGKRLVEVLRTFVRVFFDGTLLGRTEASALLDEGVNADWPEKIWVGGGDGVKV